MSQADLRRFTRPLRASEDALLSLALLVLHVLLAPPRIEMSEMLRFTISPDRTPTIRP
jgi:hypothetical protein